MKKHEGLSIKIKWLQFCLIIFFVLFPGQHKFRFDVMKWSLYEQLQIDHPNTIRISINLRFETPISAMQKENIYDNDLAESTFHYIFTFFFLQPTERFVYSAY